MLAQRMAHFSHGAHPVVGHGVHDDGRATNAVAFVSDFLVSHTLQIAGGLVHVALDGIGWHIGRFGLLDGQA